MRNHLRIAVVGAILLGCNSCIFITPIFTPPRHNPDAAAHRAVVFAREALIDRNQPVAYDYLSEKMRRKLSFDQYIDMLIRMHPKSFPVEVTAAEYEPAPDKQALFIWLTGVYRGEQFYYRLRLEGTTEAGYKVAEMLRVVRLPASQSRAPLPVRRSTAGLE